MNSIVNKLNPTATCSYITKMFASGRWYPQPEYEISKHRSRPPTQGIHRRTRLLVVDNSSLGKDANNSGKLANCIHVYKAGQKHMPFPVFAKPRGNGKKIFNLVPWKNGEMLADYVLFEESMKLAETKWLDYDGMTRDEKDIYIEHLKAVKDRKLSYIDPKTKLSVMTVSQLLHQGKCCGNGCRHCPYGMENASEDVKKNRKWNGAFYV